jgi:hypothetical protein
MGDEQRVVMAADIGLRDWMAGQALMGVLAAEACADGTGVRVSAACGESAAVFARMAYNLADAMLAARKPQPAVRPAAESA